MRVVVECPAKVNLFLAVGPPDSRGYHALRTIFQAVSLCDTLTIDTAAEADSFECPDLPTSENSVLKTWRLAREIARLPSMAVRLEKRIPSEAGLGGGSSDAAGFLRGLRALPGVRLSEIDERTIARAVGSDVPFFLVGGRARAEGYGERLTPMPDVDQAWMVLAKPPVGCSTAKAYARLDEAPRDWREFPEDDLLFNDFERVAPCESLEFIERLLAVGARDAGLTGSGSAVFGRFAAYETAARAHERLLSENLTQSWLVRTLDRSESVAISVMEPSS